MFYSFFVQNEESRKLLESIGIHDTMVVGDTRFDRVLQIKEASKQLPIVERFVKGTPEDPKRSLLQAHHGSLMKKSS